MKGIAVGELQLAAEDLSWLVDRGYDAEHASAFVAERRKLTTRDRLLLATSGRAQAHYKHHIARELEPDDVARRPLRIDAASAIATIVAASTGDVLLESLAGLHVLPGWQRPALGDSDAVTDAVARLGAALEQVRPSAVTWFLDRGAVDAEAIAPQLEAAYRPKKAKVTVELVDDAVSALTKSSAVASNDVAVLDTCISWLNLSALALAATTVHTLRL